MSGRNADEGQLALMDAVVFFISAITVTCVLFSTVPHASDNDISPSKSWFDAGRTLTALLRSSLGSEVRATIHGEPLIISERTDIAECILLEAHVIAEGDGASDFGALDLKLSEILNAVCGPFMEPQLSVWLLSNGTPYELFSLPGSPMETPVAYAATAELADSEGTKYLVLLRSVPSASSESRRIGSSDAYLGPRVLLAPHDVQVLQDYHDDEQGDSRIDPERRL